MTTFTWTIRNFDLCPYPCGQCLHSPRFSLYSSHMPKFRLMLYPRGINRKVSSYVSLYIVANKDEGDVSKVASSCQLGVLDSEETRLSCKKINNPFLKANCEGSPKLIRGEKLFNERDVLLPGGNLTVFCEISMINDETPVNNKKSFIVEYFTDEDLTELSDAFIRLYESEQHCDLDLVTSEKTFKVHKALLHARFPEILGKADGDSCLVEKVGTPTMNSLLRYLYSGTLKKSQVNLYDIVKYTCKIPPQLKSLLIQGVRKVQISTTITQRVLSFTWNIANFSTLTSDQNLEYTLIGDESCSWTWLSFFLSVSKTDEEIESFVVTIERYSNECSRVICKIEVLGFSKTFEHTFEKENRWTLPVFKIKEILTTNESLTEASFNFEITVTDGSVSHETNKIEFHPRQVSGYEQVDDLKPFQQDLKNLLNDSKFTDVTLVSGNEKFPAHKFVLCARSSFFSEKFQNESLESGTVVTDLDPWVVKNMLSYMYCVDIRFKDASTEEVVGLYSAANKYGIPSLKNKSLNWLKSILNAENAGEILISADECDDRDLKERVYEFVLSHPKEIASSKEWKEAMLKRSELVLETLNRALSFIPSKK